MVQTAPQQPAEGLLELNKDTFNDYIQSAGDAVVVVDFFTDWCGPCKLIYPELVKLSRELAPAATIVKFNCNQANKELAKTLGIKVGDSMQHAMQDCRSYTTC
jgi:thioredoxin 1